VKEEKNFFLTAGSNGLNSFNYIDANGLNTNFNFNAAAYGIAEDKLTSLSAFRLSLPTYRIQKEKQGNFTINNNGTSYNTQLAQNLNSVAVNVLKERFVIEMANALARQLTKKLVEKGTQAVAEGIVKSSDKKNNTNTTTVQKEQKKKDNEQKADRVGEVAGFVMNMINTATEKADTRNWQSLPAFISYVRIPLNDGENIITVSNNGNPITLKINAGRGLQMVSVVVD
ncbi:MAG: hypothetical protein LH615_07405, partial [Ferruginibacter sp.]|nr:hypothetical protein [Ferruginibacter sp.]